MRVTAVSFAIFFSVLALLWFRVSAGEDPVLGAQASKAQVTSTTGSSDTSSRDDGTTSSSSASSIPTTSAS
jgi:hypothetical protein